MFLDSTAISSSFVLCPSKTPTVFHPKLFHFESNGSMLSTSFVFPVAQNLLLSTTTVRLSSLYFLAISADSHVIPHCISPSDIITYTVPGSFLTFLANANPIPAGSPIPIEPPANKTPGMGSVRPINLLPSLQKVLCYLLFLAH